MESNSVAALLGFLLCAGVSVLFIAIFAVVVFFIVRQVAGGRGGGGIGRGRVRTIIEDWAADRGYELLEVRDIPRGADHPFKDRFGFGFGKKPAVAKRIDVTDRKGRERSGWIYIRARRAGLHHFEFMPDSVEVAWEN